MMMMITTIIKRKDRINKNKNRNKSNDKNKSKKKVKITMMMMVMMTIVMMITKTPTPKFNLDSNNVVQPANGDIYGQRFRLFRGFAFCIDFYHMIHNLTLRASTAPLFHLYKTSVKRNVNSLSQMATTHTERQAAICTGSKRHTKRQTNNTTSSMQPETSICEAIFR